MYPCCWDSPSLPRLRRPDAANRHRLAAGSAGQVRRLAAVGGSTPGHHGAIGLAADLRPWFHHEKWEKSGILIKQLEIFLAFFGMQRTLEDIMYVECLRCYSYIYMYVLTNSSFNFIYVFFHSSICGCAATMIGWRLHWHPLGRNPFPW